MIIMNSIYLFVLIFMICLLSRDVVKGKLPKKGIFALVILTIAALLLAYSSFIDPANL